MERRLCDLVDLVENNSNGAVLAVKEGVRPIDLIRLGGFDGDETMFRMSKHPDTVSVTVFRDGRPPYTMNYGASTTIVPENQMRVRDQVRECVNLDFGIFTDRPFSGRDFNLLVEETCGERTLDSPRRFELKKGGPRYSLFVNDQHVALIDRDRLEGWLGDRNIRMEVSRGGDRADVGHLLRLEALGPRAAASPTR